VAIATALMPPLCTAGFGLASGKWDYMLGAVYLFFINSMFICLATFLIVKHLKFHKHEFKTKLIEKRVVRSIWIIVTITILPSVYLAYKIVERSIFENNAKNFVQKEFKYVRSQVVTRNFRIDGQKKIIELLIVGQELPPNVIDSLKQRMPLYGLDSVTLVVHQGLNAKQEIDLAQIKTSILEEMFMNEKKNDSINIRPQKIDLPIPDIRAELKALYPELETYSLSQTVVHRPDSLHSDTISLLTASFKNQLTDYDRIKLQSWVKNRIKSDSVKLLIETVIRNKNRH
jgi:uncharacterized membrane protein